MLFEKCWRDKYLEGLNDAKRIPRLCSTPRAGIFSSIERALEEQDIGQADFLLTQYPRRCWC